MHGTVADAGVEATIVKAIAIERRSLVWYYFTGTTWVRASSQAVTTSKAPRFVVNVSGSTWSVRLSGVPKGLLRVTANATDRLGTTSGPTVRQQMLS